MDFETLMNSLHFTSNMWEITTPIIFSGADVITGFIQAIINNNISSKKMRDGLLHKFLLIIVIILSFIGDLTFGLDIISKAVCCYIILMETTSILENISNAGINLGKLTSILKVSNENKTGEDENE